MLTSLTSEVCLHTGRAKAKLLDQGALDRLLAKLRMLEGLVLLGYSRESPLVVRGLQFA